MSDSQLVVLVALLAPLVVLGAVAMVRGYHLSLKVFRPRRKDHPDG
jgi:predicted small integral membrane protein